MAIDVVFLDVGGVLYGDLRYMDSVRRALRELGGSFDDEEFDRAYAECRRTQSGSFRRQLTRRFLGPEADPAAVEAAASKWWHYGPEELYADVRPCLERLSANYRLGILANQPSRVRKAMRRDGIEAFFEHWAVSGDLGIEKPDPRFFVHALQAFRVEPSLAAMVGDRLDYDVRPARTAGMHTVWVLRGEAPDEPTPEQLAEPEATVRSLDELFDAIGRLG